MDVHNQNESFSDHDDEEVGYSLWHNDTLGAWGLNSDLCSISASFDVDHDQSHDRYALYAEVNNVDDQDTWYSYHPTPAHTDDLEWRLGSIYTYRHPGLAGQWKRNEELLAQIETQNGEEDLPLRVYQEVLVYTKIARWWGVEERNEFVMKEILPDLEPIDEGERTETRSLRQTRRNMYRPDITNTSWRNHGRKPIYKNRRTINKEAHASIANTFYGPSTESLSFLEEQADLEHEDGSEQDFINWCSDEERNQELDERYLLFSWFDDRSLLDEYLKGNYRLEQEPTSQAA
jgi:hypothetical protein